MVIISKGAKKIRRLSSHKAIILRRTARNFDFGILA